MVYAGGCLEASDEGPGCASILMCTERTARDEELLMQSQEKAVCPSELSRDAADALCCHLNKSPNYRPNLSR
jgi:hypothetical protein